MSGQSVRQIVERCQQGDREAFGQLYTLMSDRLRKVCRRYVSDEHTVNDLLHDSFILIFSKINTLNDPSKAEAWMQKITQNLTINYLQHQKQTPVISLDDLEEPLTTASPEVMPITYDEIMNLVDTLPNSYQQVFRLSVLEGLSHQEIAALLNIEPHTSSSDLFKAKKLLRNSLAILLLGLLCISLPLGWYWMHVDSKDKEVKMTQTTESSPEPTISPSRTNSKSDMYELPVRHVRTIQGARSLSDSKPLLADVPQEVEMTDTIPTPEKPESQPSQEPATQPSQQPESHPQKQPVLQPELPVPVRSRQQDWSVQLAYSGINNDHSFNLPDGEQSMNDPKMDTITHHRMPLTIRLLVDKMLNQKLSVGTGLQYSQLYSETQEGNTYSLVEKEQRLRYLGIPVRVSWYPVNTNHWRLYGTAQTMLELPLHSILEKRSIVGGKQIESEKLSLSPSVQWSLGIGAGLEYRLTPVIGIYAEPSIQYYFKTGDDLDSYRTAHPINFSIPFGIRITF